MLDDSPLVHVVWLVQTLRVSNGDVVGAPAVPQDVPRGSFASTQACIVAISSGAGASAGAGGIGRAASRMRSSERSARDLDGSAGDGFARSSYVRRAGGEDER